MPVAKFAKAIAGDAVGSQLLRGAVGSVALRVLAIILRLVLAVLLARVLGPAGYGIYSYVFALVSVMAIPAQLGLPGLVVRETAKARVRQEWGLMRGLWQWASKVAIAFSLMIGVAAAGLAAFFHDRFTDLQLTTFAFGLLLVPLGALGNLRGAAVRGLGKAVIGQLPEEVLRPLLTILLVLAVIVRQPAESLTAALAMGLQVLAVAVTFVIGAYMLWKLRPAPLALKPAPAYQHRHWLRSCLPLAFVAGMMLINGNTDVLMLGFFASEHEVGSYRAVVQAATLVSFGVQAVGMVAAPYFARLHAAGNMLELQRAVTLSSRASAAVALPAALALIFWGEPILTFVFGREYAGGAIALGILAAGHLLNASMGVLGGLLNMTGHERDTARGVAIAAVVNIVLNLALVPSFGMNGAALATSLTLITWGVLLQFAVRERLGIESVAFMRSRRL